MLFSAIRNQKKKPLTFQESWMTVSKCHSFSFKDQMAVSVNIAAILPPMLLVFSEPGSVTLTSALFGLYRPTDWCWLGDQAALLRGPWHSPCHAMRTNFLGDNIFPRARLVKDVLPPRQILFFIPCVVEWLLSVQLSKALCPHCFPCYFLKRWFPESN